MGKIIPFWMAKLRTQGRREAFRRPATSVWDSLKKELPTLMFT